MKNALLAAILIVCITHISKAANYDLFGCSIPVQQVSYAAPVQAVIPFQPAPVAASGYNVGDIGPGGGIITAVGPWQRVPQAIPVCSTQIYGNSCSYCPSGACLGGSCSSGCPNGQCGQQSYLQSYQAPMLSYRGGCSTCGGGCSTCGR